MDFFRLFYRAKRRARFVPTMLAMQAVLLLAGCSNSTSSIPESIRRKARETTNDYASSLAAEAAVSSVTTSADNSRPQKLIPPYDDWTMRKTAMFALGRMGAPAVPALIQALRSPDHIVRQHAVETLSRIGPDAAAAVPDLVRALNDQDPLVRKVAARALGQIGPAAAEAVPELIRAMIESPD